MSNINAHINLHKAGVGVQMQFDSTMIEKIKHEGFDGLEFKIQFIIPVSNLPSLLGINPAKEPELLAKV